MNERIKQLAIQAGAEHFIGDNAHLPIGRLDKEGIEKFAELIVQECIDTVLDSSVEYCTRPQIINEIKLHFGVEE